MTVSKRIFPNWVNSTNGCLYTSSSNCASVPPWAFPGSKDDPTAFSIALRETWPARWTCRTSSTPWLSSTLPTAGSPTPIFPTTLFVESERRQIIFGRAVGIPTFFVRQDTENRFLRRIVEKTERVRPSRRYPGYLRVHHREYCRSLVQVIREDAADLIEMFGMSDAIDDLENRLEDPDRHSALGKLTSAILGKDGPASPMLMKAGDFNRAAEKYYRNDLRKAHILEGFRSLEADLEYIASAAGGERQTMRQMLRIDPEGSGFINVHSQCPAGSRRGEGPARNPAEADRASHRDRHLRPPPGGERFAAGADQSPAGRSRMMRTIFSP